jgi:hypothetical protein
MNRPSLWPQAIVFFCCALSPALWSHATGIRVIKK